MNIDHSQTEVFEKYHHRITEVQNLSDFIAIANLQLNKVSQQLGWTKTLLSKENDISLEECLIDKSHHVRKEKASQHIQTCLLKKEGFTSVTTKDMFSPLFGYKDSKNIVSVYIGHNVYKKIGCKPLTVNDDLLETDTLLEQNEEINQYVCTDNLDELRFIYSWSSIPNRYFSQSWKGISISTFKEWLSENLQNIEDQFSHIPGLINSIIGLLNIPLTADEMVANVKDILKQESKQFVLKLWKFIAAKSLCLHQHIPEHTRNEFHYYGTSTSSNNNNRAHLKINRSCPSLPMEWVHYNLTREQKLKVYEEVIQTSKMVVEPSTYFKQLEEEAEEQMKVLATINSEAKGQRTHLEVMAELRDYKRRRQSYRGKNKANRKMSGLEVLREVVEQQMFYLDILRGNKNSKDGSNCDINATTGAPNEESNTVREKRCGKEERTVREEKRRTNDTNVTCKRNGKSKERERRGRSKSHERHRSRSPDTNRDRSRSRNRYRTKDSNYNRRSRSSDRRRSNDDRRRSHGSTSRRRTEISNVTYYN